MSDFAARYRTHELAQRANSLMTSGVTRSTLFLPAGAPFALRGDGFRVWDQFDHSAVDLSNNYTALLHGHNHPPTTEAAQRALANGSSFSLRTPAEVELADHLRARTQQPHWRFSNSGTEAVMTAVRAARAYTGRNILVKFVGSYHGTANDVAPAGAPGLPNSRSSEVIECAPGDIDQLSELFAAHPGEIAAVLIDLMPNRAGLIPADPVFVRQVRELTRTHGTLLIVDEVISLRLGRGGLARAYEVEADLITAGKIIGGGMPVGAVGGRVEVLDVFNPRKDGSVDWGGTFSANPVSMAAGLATLTAYTNDVQHHVDTLGNTLRAELVRAGIGVSGQGSLSRIVDQRFSPDLWWRCYEAGVLLGTNGLLCLSTPMTVDTISEVSAALTDVFQ